MCSDGMEALEMLKRTTHSKPDLVLSDVMMPRLDGLGLLKEMRSIEELKDIPVIFLSAQAGEEAK
jgi:CheY-like chemotaxis protein